MTLQEEIAQAIKDGFDGGLGKVTLEHTPDDIIYVWVEGYNVPIRVLENDVDIPIPPFATEHAAGIRLDVQAILASREVREGLDQ